MDSQTQKKHWTRVSWRNVGVTLLVIFIALWVVYPATMHVMVWYFAEKEATDPLAAVVPKPLPVTEPADLSHGSDTKAFGYSLRVPFPILKESTGPKFVAWNFADGLSATVFDMVGDSMGPGLLVNSTPAQAAAYQGFLGERALSSKYEFLRVELNTTAADVSFWQSRSRNAAAMTRMMTKPTPLLKTKALYSISKGQMRGFQFGDPDRSQSVTVMLFDPSDRETWLLLHNSAQFRWTQPQINAVIASIHPTQ